ncbi:MAG: hypothetical protein IK031_03300 [Bacteroidales bacterium]|nr:hypothetical protein [Bacteroidales bacterium]
MKKSFILAAMAAAVLAACSVENPETPQTIAPEGTVKVFRASFDDESSKTVLSMNGAGTHADVLWEAGDAIRVVTMFDGGGFANDVFSTTTGGAKEADFYSNKWTVYNPQKVYALYPADKWINGDDLVVWYDGTDLNFRLPVPIVQQAVAGGLESGLNYATAYSEDPSSDELHFRNAFALLRFKLGGSNANKVSRIQFDCNATIAGDCIYSPALCQFDLDGHLPPFEYNGHQNSITLNGPFTAGQDYYFAMVPATTEGFTMTFFDESGGTITKTSSKTLTLNRSRITDFGTITLNDQFYGGVERYMTHTKGSRPACMVILGEAFTASEQDRFRERACQAIDFIFDTEPYKTYKDYFNVYLMPTVSEESGASVTDGNGGYVTKRNTFFSAGWSATSYADLTADYNKVFNYVRPRCPETADNTFDISEVPIMMLINDSRYGGICWTWQTGFSLALVPMSYDGADMAWAHPSTVAVDNTSASSEVKTLTTEEIIAQFGINQNNWRCIALHEYAGHGFGRLGDEYWYGSTQATSNTIATHSWSSPMSFNLSASYDNVPWQEEVLDELLFGSISISSANMSKYEQRVGIFQGGDGYCLGRWRSEQISCMIDNRQYFSLWQRMLIVKRIMKMAGETFNLASFYSLDDATDPIRDVVKSGTSPLLDATGTPDKTVTLCPPLLPPVDMGEYR